MNWQRHPFDPYPVRSGQCSVCPFPEDAPIHGVQESPDEIVEQDLERAKMIAPVAQEDAWLAAWVAEWRAQVQAIQVAYQRTRILRQLDRILVLVDAAREAADWLRDVAAHDPACAIETSDDEDAPCDCGLDDVLTGLEKVLEG